jgi:hypothetical protein
MEHPFLNFANWLILVIALSAGVMAQSQPEESTSDNAKAGAISGRVVDQNGAPLANALVSIRSYGALGPGHSTTTDSEGNFQVSGLEPLAYLVAASVPTYVAAARDADVNPIGYYRIGDSVRLEMIKGGVITGTIKRANGDAVVSVLVRAYMIRDNKGQPARYGAPVRSRNTDDRGVYRIYGLPAGTYVVSAGGGSGLTGFNVDAYGTDVPTYAPSSTRDTATEITVGPGEEITNVDIRYREETGHTVSGNASGSVVTDQPVGSNVTLTSIFSGTAQASYSYFQPPGTRGFAFSGVADGDYDVIAQSYSPATEWVVSEPRRIKVRGADVTGIELVAKPLGSITGSIVFEDSKAAECQGKRRQELGEIVVGPWHNEKNVPKDQPQFVWGLGTPTLPDKQGRFTLRSLAAGQYRFNVRPMAKYWYLKSISWPASAPASSKSAPPDRPNDAARNWTTLRSGERVSGLTITFAEGAASLHGKIEAGEGQKLPPRLFVYLVPAEREKTDDILRFFTSLVSDDRSFSLGNLPPGGYRIIAEAATENESNILSKLRLPDETELRAKLLRDAEAAKDDIEFKPCQNVTDYHLPF